jgi:uncharacterized protein YndB with AHSA1/START domain
MSTVSRSIKATPQRVFAELADAWMYTSWVVGAAHIRGVDAHWPAAGSKLYHKVGAWPLTVSDDTEVIEVAEPNRLVLQARAWPFGEARVELTIAPDDDGALVTMTEQPTNGPGRWLHTPIQEAFLRRRNLESLARLASIAENRPSPQQE